MKKAIAFFVALSFAGEAFAGLPFVGKRDIEIPTGGSHPPVYKVIIKADGNTKITSTNCDMSAGGSGCQTNNLYQGKFENPITFKKGGILHRLTFNTNKTVSYSEYDSDSKQFSSENCLNGVCIVNLD